MKNCPVRGDACGLLVYSRILQAKTWTTYEYVQNISYQVRSFMLFKFLIISLCHGIINKRYCEFSLGEGGGVTLAKTE